jgi:hypothetical protein
MSLISNCTRWTLGDSGPITTGVVQFGNATANPMEWRSCPHITSGYIESIELEVRAPYWDGAAPATAAPLPPLGAALVVDVEQSVNQGTTWTSMNNIAEPGPGDAPAPSLTQMAQLPAGAPNSSSPGPANSWIVTGQMLRLNVHQVGSTQAGQCITCTLNIVETD